MTATVTEIMNGLHLYRLKERLLDPFRENVRERLIVLADHESLTDLTHRELLTNVSEDEMMRD